MGEQREEDGPGTAFTQFNAANQALLAGFDKAIQDGAPAIQDFAAMTLQDLQDLAQTGVQLQHVAPAIQDGAPAIQDGAAMTDLPAETARPPAVTEAVVGPVGPF